MSGELLNNFSEQKANKIEPVQVLRGFAALFVLIFHAYNFSNLYFLTSPYKIHIVEYCEKGVDLFFLISGFIMFITTDKILPSCSAARMFFINRLIRIWPLYITATIIVVLIFPRAYSGQGAFLNDFLKSILFYPYTSDYVARFPLLFNGWTLSYEIYFYLILSIFLITFNRRVLMISIYFMTTIIFIPFLYRWEFFSIHTAFAGLITQEPLHTKHVWLNFITFYANIYFLIGMWLGFFYQNYWQKYAAQHSPMIFKFVLVGSILVMGWFNYHFFVTDKYFKSNLFLMITISAFFISFVVVFNRYKFNSLLLFMGNISYSFYLWQVLSMEIIRRIYASNHIQGHVASLIQFMLIILINSVISYFSYKYIEIWFSKKLKGIF